jgi:NADPH:quinone reductase-like Zn-dependent oxidoreductase
VLAGNILPVIDSSFPLADVLAAHEYMRSGRHFGKLLLECQVS